MFVGVRVGVEVGVEVAVGVGVGVIRFTRAANKGSGVALGKNPAVVSASTVSVEMPNHAVNPNKAITSSGRIPALRDIRLPIAALNGAPS